MNAPGVIALACADRAPRMAARRAGHPLETVSAGKHPAQSLRGVRGNAARTAPHQPSKIGQARAARRRYRVAIQEPAR